MAVTLVVFGYGPVEAEPRPRLNLYGRLNALAAGMLYKRGGVGRVLITGGRTGGAALPSEAELMRRYMGVFELPQEAFVLEEKATDTITNFVFVANLLDRSSAPDNLTFLALGFHLPRIRYLAALFGLEGDFIPAEEVVRERSYRHRRLLDALLSLEKEEYVKRLTAEVRAVRGLETLPDYWLPPAAGLESEARLKRLLEREQVQAFLKARRLEPRTPSNLKIALSSLPRRFPEPREDDREAALRLYKIPEAARV